MACCVHNRTPSARLGDVFSDVRIPATEKGGIDPSNGLGVATRPGRVYTAPEPAQVAINVPDFRWFRPSRKTDKTQTMDEVDSLMQRANALALAGAKARRTGNESAAESSYESAFGLAQDAMRLAGNRKPETARLDILKTAACLALEFGNVTDARRLIDEAVTADLSTSDASEWQRLRNISEWPDEWLVAAVRREPPDEAALDELVERYWKTLFGRCQMLTLNGEKARDLAQDAWRRVLRSRQGLKPGGNFPAYLTTIATNLWRDAHRAATRAGAMADFRLESLDAARSGDEENLVTLADVLPDLSALGTEEQKVLALDIDQALERLSPLLRDVIISRFLIGESCMEIGLRHRRTEQTVSGWVRQGLREMKNYLSDSASVSVTPNES